ncbi:MAG: Arm DNA-binding domain-containing protein [Alphaproteobacteria bacterium]
MEIVVPTANPAPRRSSLTDLVARRIKPPAKGQVDHFDKGYPGLALRVSYGGRRTWVYFYRLYGKQHRHTLGTYPAMEVGDAHDAWRAARDLVQNGIDPAVAKAGCRAMMAVGRRAWQDVGIRQRASLADAVN